MYMKRRVKTGIFAALFAMCAAIPTVSLGATRISIDKVSQRWPWNNKVDITYTVTEGQNLSTSNFCKIVFTTVIDGKTYTIDGTTDVGASANSGTHTVTWTLPDGVKRSDCTITASIYSADAPSGDDYMVIDLDTGVVTYEGLLATQEASNGRYNTDLYKSTNVAGRCCMVLRKVAAGGTYPTGDSVNYLGVNSATNWVPRRDYYIGVFPVTQYQFKKIYGSNPSAMTADGTTAAEGTGEAVAQRPVDSVQWLNHVRGVLDPSSPITSSSDGAFLQRLNHLTGGKFAFDLPTEVMFEIAQRSGESTVYAWGVDEQPSYYTAALHAGRGKQHCVVGKVIPNNWGIYDMTGNVYEWCLDDDALGDLASAPDPFTPSSTNPSGRRRRRGGPSGEWTIDETLRASCRSAYYYYHATAIFGFRISVIAK